MGRYTSLHGVAAAARFFTRKFDYQVSETTLHTMKKAYLQEVTRKRVNEDNENIDLLPHQKRGRPVFLGESLDGKVQMYLRRVWDGGGVVTERIAIAAAWDILLSCDRSKLVEFGGHVMLNRFWAYSLLKRMNFVKWKVTPLLKASMQSEWLNSNVWRNFSQDVMTTVEMEEIPSELILNWDQTGIKIAPSNTWTMEQGSKRVDVAGANDKRQITAVCLWLSCKIFYQSRSSIRVKSHAVIPTTCFHLSRTSHTLPNTGQTRRPWSSMWRR